MKKSRIIPSILLLVLCFGVLGVGIFAAIPSSTNIKGTLTIIAPSKDLEISGIVTGATETKVLNTDSIHDVTVWDLSTLTFDLRDKMILSEVKDIVITVHIKNKSLFEFGAYFYKKDATLDQKGNATINSFENLSSLLVNEDDVTLANVTLTDYSHIMPADDDNENTTLDEIDMTITFSLAQFFYEAPKSQFFNYILKIEQYIPNYETDAAYTGSETFIKVSSDISGTKRTSIPASAFANKGIKKVVIPGTVTEIKSSAFLNCTTLETVTLSPIIDTIASNAFSGTSALTKITKQGQFTLYDSLLTVPTSATSFTSKMSNFGSLVTDVVIPNSTTIADDAFTGCNAIESVEYSKTVAGQYTFVDGKVTITSQASAVTSSFCDDFLKPLVLKVTIPAAATSISGATRPSEDSYYDESTSPFGLCGNLMSVVFEERTNAITLGACAINCTKLTSIYIPKEVTLTAIDFVVEESRGDGTYDSHPHIAPLFYGTSNDFILYMENEFDTTEADNSWWIKQQTYGNSYNIGSYDSTSAEKITIISGISFEASQTGEEIGDGYTYNFITKTLSISEGTTTIENGTHEWDKYKTKAENLFIPKSVTSIAGATITEFNYDTSTDPIITNDGVFNDYSALKNVIIESGSTCTLAAGTFLGCTALESVFVPQNANLNSGFYALDGAGGSFSAGPFMGSNSALVVFFEGSRNAKWTWRDIDYGHGTYDYGSLDLEDFPTINDTVSASSEAQMVNSGIGTWINYHENVSYEQFNKE